jgi:hypothetical protein
MSGLIDEVNKYYSSKARHCAVVGTEVAENETYSVDFLVDRRLVIRCQMPIDKRNFLAALLVGIGPRFIHPSQLMEYREASRYSGNDDYGFVLRNLSLLDEHLASGVLQIVSLMGN